MRDFNFFSPYIEIDKNSKKKNNIVIYSILALVLLMGSLSTWGIIKIHKINKEIISYETYLSSKQDELNKANEKRRKLEVMRKYYGIVEKINVNMEDGNNVNSIAMDEISYTIPQDVFFKSMTIDGTNVQIQGVSGKRTSIGELEHNLKNLAIFNDVHIGNINKEEQSNGFTFTVKCSMNGGEM